MRLQAGAQRPPEEYLGGLQPRFIIVCGDPQPPNLGRPSQRPHTGCTERRDCRQLRKLHDGQRRLDALGDGELLANLLKGLSQTPPWRSCPSVSLQASIAAFRTGHQAAVSAGR